jgi:peroxiredoxin
LAASTGEKASDFQLPASTGGKMQLGSFLGEQPVLLVFYSFSFEDVCRDDLRMLRDKLDLFAAGGVQVLAVSCDGQAVQRAWAVTEGFVFPLLSDFWPHGEVARAYDAFDLDRGCPQHVVVAVDATGRVVARLESDPKSPRPAEHLEHALTLLTPRAPEAATDAVAAPAPTEPPPAAPEPATPEPATPEATVAEATVAEAMVAEAGGDGD